jgi:hypothetical protein
LDHWEVQVMYKLKMLFNSTFHLVIKYTNWSNQLYTILKLNLANCFSHFQILTFNSPNCQITINLWINVIQIPKHCLVYNRWHRVYFAKTVSYASKIFMKLTNVVNVFSVNFWLKQTTSLTLSLNGCSR